MTRYVNIYIQLYQGLSSLAYKDAMEIMMLIN